MQQKTYRVITINCIPAWNEKTIMEMQLPYHNYSILTSVL